MSNWDKFIHWMDNTYVRLNRLALVLGLISIGVSVYNNDYGLWFWLSVLVTLWSLYDIVKHHVARINVPQDRPVGPEDTPEWSNNNKQG